MLLKVPFYTFCLNQLRANCNDQACVEELALPTVKLRENVAMNLEVLAQADAVDHIEIQWHTEEVFANKTKYFI